MNVTPEFVYAPSSESDNIKFYVFDDLGNAGFRLILEKLRLEILDHIGVKTWSISSE